MTYEEDYSIPEEIASLFPNDASCLRLATAVVMEISEDWQIGKRYIR